MEKNNKKTIAIAAILILFAIAGFISYEVAVVYNTQPLPFDKAVQDFFFSLRGPVQNVIMSMLTHLSDTVTIVAFCLVLLILPNRKTYGLPVSAACIGGLAVFKPMKHLVLRARPDVSLRLVQESGYSFPSGHSVTSVIFYGLLLYLIQKNCKNEKLRKVLSLICGILAVTIGPSRIYVGVHWPTDVLAGWCIGGGTLLIAILILSWRTQKKEHPDCKTSKQ